MVAYLSDEWLDLAGGALSSSAELSERTADLDMAIAYEVTAAPSGKVAYALRFDHGTTTLTRGASDAPVSFSLDYDTAVEVARGEIPAQAAFMQGRLKLVGDVNVLIRDGAVLDGITDALAALRADTEF